LREKDPQRVLEQAKNAVRATGTDELSLLSLSTGDYSCVNPVLTELMNQFSNERVAVSLPSTRVDALAPSLLEQIKRVRKTGFTLAPEAGSQRMRDIIQKEYQEDELIEAARQIFDLGWRSLKLYFMLGLPGETRDDLMGIVDLTAKVKAAGGGRCEVTASVSTFVPKAHTPFQWAAQIDVQETQQRQSLLRRELSRRRLRFKWHDARTSYLEGIFSRGDRRVAKLLRAAYDLGCRFDGWTEHCRFDLWEQAMAATGIEPGAYLGRRYLNEALPWDHLSSGVTKAFLQRELAHAVEGRLTPDCSVERCTYCGACDFKTVRNVDYHLRGAKGSDHRGERIDNWAQVIVAEEDAEAWEPRGWRKIRERVEKRGGVRKAAVTPSVLQPIATETANDRGAPLDTKAGLGNAEEWLAAGGEGLAAPPPSSSPAVQRIRSTYSKVGAARFISHLELIDVFTRALRRAALPVAYSSGHHPQPRLRFSPGLPLGAESDCEVVDIDFSEALSVEDFEHRFAGQLLEGITLLDVREVSLKEPSPDRGLSGFRYLIDIDTLVDGEGAADIDQRLAAFARSASFPMLKRRPRGDKEIDARALVTRAERIDRSTVELDVRFTADGSIKPSDFLAALFDLDETTARALPLRKTTSYYDSQ
jgi:radical SAM-linked protein